MEKGGWLLPRQVEAEVSDAPEVQGLFGTLGGANSSIHDLRGDLDQFSASQKGACSRRPPHCGGWRVKTPSPSWPLMMASWCSTGHSQVPACRRPWIPHGKPEECGTPAPIPHPSHRERPWTTALRVHTPCPSGGKPHHAFPQAWIP